MKILTRLPFSEVRSEVDTPAGILEVKPYQNPARLPTLGLRNRHERSEAGN